MVSVDEVKGRVVVRGLDLLDGTPVLDIDPDLDPNLTPTPTLTLTLTLTRHARARH